MRLRDSIGIDFGTTNSSVARAVGGRVELLPFAGGAVASRSILYLEKGARGVLSATGAAAIERYLTVHGEGLAAGRLVQSLKSYLPVRSLTTTEVFGRAYGLEDLIARILGDLRVAAEGYFQCEIRRATVGRPVKFVGAETAADEEFALERLRAAYGRAGFEEVTFELEPVAAAAAFAVGSARAETILIGDFGGGTSDFSVLRVEPGRGREVLATAGLGFAGDAFDAKIVRHLVAPALGSETLARGGKSIPALPAWIYANLERWHYLSFLRTRNVMELLKAGIKRAEEPEKLEALRAVVEEDLGYPLHQAVQKTKTALSVGEEAEFMFAELRARVRRGEFEEWIAPELGLIAGAVDKVVRGVAVDRVFLTGGTSFVPAVRRIFEERFGGRVSAGGEFTSVASGLALL